MQRLNDIARRGLIALAVTLTALTLSACGGAEVVDTTNLIVEIRGNRIYVNQRVHFGHDSDEILADSFELLDRVAAVIGEHEEIVRVQVQGHSSVDGDDAHNLELSGRRASAVAEYLRGHGVGVEITSQGYGETYPLCREETEACHEQNRRVEFFVDQR